MYKLYYSKKDKIIEIKPLGKLCLESNVTDEVTPYNDCYFICKNRKKLLEKAKEIKQKWITEATIQLQVLNSIEIK